MVIVNYINWFWMALTLPHPWFQWCQGATRTFGSRVIQRPGPLGQLGVTPRGSTMGWGWDMIGSITMGRSSTAHLIWVCWCSTHCAFFFSCSPLPLHLQTYLYQRSNFSMLRWTPFKALSLRGFFWAPEGSRLPWFFPTWNRLEIGRLWGICGIPCLCLSQVHKHPIGWPSLPALW